MYYPDCGCEEKYLCEFCFYKFIKENHFYDSIEIMYEVSEYLNKFYKKDKEKVWKLLDNYIKHYFDECGLDNFMDDLFYIDMELAKRAYDENMEMWDKKDLEEAEKTFGWNRKIKLSELVDGGIVWLYYYNMNVIQGDFDLESNKERLWNNVFKNWMKRESYLWNLEI
jgi:hypothetical protein